MREDRVHTFASADITFCDNRQCVCLECKRHYIYIPKGVPVSLAYFEFDELMGEFKCLNMLPWE